MIENRVVAFLKEGNGLGWQGILARTVPAPRDMFHATLFFCSMRGVGRK